MENPIKHGWFRGTPILGNLHILLALENDVAKPEPSTIPGTWVYGIGFTMLYHNIPTAWYD